MSRLTQEQEKAVAATDRHVLVCAGAGSGKTHVLVERYLAILRLNPEASVEDVVAVTYTTRAAREMKSRLKARMEEMARQSAGGNESQRWESFRQDVDGARIGTIHSLCESILKSFPAESGVDPRFEILDEVAAADFVRRSVEAALAAAWSSDAGGTDPLLSSFPAEQIIAVVSSMIRAGASLRDALAAMPDTDFPSWADRWQAQLADYQRQLLAELTADVDWLSALRCLEGMPGASAPDSLARAAQLAIGCAPALFDSAGDIKERFAATCALAEIRLSGGRISERFKEMRDALKTVRDVAGRLVKDVPDTLNDKDRLAYGCLASLTGIYRQAQDRYEAEKQAARGLDFDDLILKCHSLLSNPESQARRYYNERIAAVLVDEFQDTNDLQAEIIACLAGAKARLFLIGDDKQSIYSFQGADIATFNRWRGMMQDRVVPAGRSLPLAGESLCCELTRSFRSRPGLVAFVNSISASLFADNPAFDFTARHQALQAVRDDEDGAFVEVVLFNPADKREAGESLDLRRIEAQAVVAWILELIEARSPVFDKESNSKRQIRLDDFAILVQKSEDFALLEQALISYGLPYVTTGGRRFLEQQEIYDMENLLAFLVSPVDDHALAGVLRSPMFALADDLLHSLAAGRPGSLWASLTDACWADGAAGQLVARARSILKELLAGFGQNRLGMKLDPEDRESPVLQSHDFPFLGLGGEAKDFRKAVALDH